MFDAENLALHQSRLGLRASTNFLLCAFDIYRTLPAPQEASLAWINDSSYGEFIVGAIAEHPDSAPERTPKSWLVVGQDTAPKEKPALEFITEFDAVDDLAWLHSRYDFQEGERLAVAISHLAYFTLQRAAKGSFRNNSARLLWAATDQRKHPIDAIHGINASKFVDITFDKI